MGVSMINGETAVVGLFGFPVSHSLSPVMQNAGFRETGLNYCYVPFPVREEDLSAAVRSIGALNLRGVNVTAPHKEAVCPLLHRLSGEALFLGAVNTVVRGEGGELVGYNTDVEGFSYLLQQNLAGVDLQGARAVLLGAGGAARAVALSLSRTGVSSLAIANRTVSKAEALASLLAERGALDREKAEVLPLERERLEAALQGTGLLINALSADPWELGCLPRGGPFPLAAIDLRYAPSRLPFLEWAQGGGAAGANGLDMLLGQGAAAFTLFTGEEAPAAEMKRALLEAL